MRLEIAEETEAKRLAERSNKPDWCPAPARTRPSPLVARTGGRDPNEWDEQTFAELVFFLRTWSGSNPNRPPAVLEEPPLYAPDQIFRRAS